MKQMLCHSHFTDDLHQASTSKKCGCVPEPPDGRIASGVLNPVRTSHLLSALQSGLLPRLVPKIDLASSLLLDI